MATLQALSSPRVKNRGLNYDETIIRKIREDFIKYVDPKILLLHLHILSIEDEERIDARQNSEGRTSAARLLLQLLSHYPEWIPKLLESLLHPDVLLEHLADKIKESQDTKINKTSTVLTIEYGKERLQIVEMIKNLGDVAGNDAEKIISDSIQKLEKADKKMADEYVDKTVDEMQERVLNGIESIRAFLKRIVPREPLPEDFESELQYQAAYVAYEAKLLAFTTLLKMTKSGLDKFSETLAGILKKVSEFLSELWQWVKEKVKDIYEKVCLFVQSIKDGFNACTTESESIITTGESSV